MYQLILNEKRGRVRGLPDLPPFPAVGQQIMSQVTSEQVDIPRLARTIEQDPSVFGRIIGVANSAYFGCPDKIYTISHAIVRVLGLNVVKSLALGIVLNEPFKRSACSGFDMRQYWFHSLITALLAQRLARHIHIAEKNFVDQAYLAGMLNNLGELVLVHLFPSEMSDVYAQLQRGPDADASVLQTDIVGITSTEASAILAKKWHLPDSLQTVFRHRHSPDYEGRHWQLLCLVRLCSQLACEENIGDILEQRDIVYMADRLGLQRSQLDKLTEKMPAIYHDVENMASVMVKE